jgi:predicted NAD-dependent protein-ADP-ribosyltransferase YbiA (DUF1768 family)
MMCRKSSLFGDEVMAKKILAAKTPKEEDTKGSEHPGETGEESKGKK